MSKDFQIIQLSVDEGALKKASNRIRNQLVGCMHAHNELTILNRLLMFSMNKTADGELHDSAQSVQMWCLLQVLAAKLVETWKMLNDRFLKANPEDPALGKLTPEHKPSLDWLKEYFGVDPQKRTTHSQLFGTKRHFTTRTRDHDRHRGAPPDEIVLAPPGTVPKTSSGKIRRSAAKELHASGRIGTQSHALWIQLLHLTLTSVGPQAKRLVRLLRDAVYAAWWWLVLSAAFLSGYLAVMVLPHLAWRWSALRRIGHATFAAMGVRISTIGVQNIPVSGAVLVFNHSSYVDALVLATILPSEPAIVAKRELSRQLFAGPFLRRLGIPFVDRYDVSASLADTEALIALTRHARILVFFPEGTFTRRAGLSGFYMGAFKVAAEAQLPILPGVIRGTRSMLRGEQWMPRHAHISVEIGKPVMPSGTDFDSLLRLRDEVRQNILSRCGEPNLEDLVKPEP